MLLYIRFYRALIESGTFFLLALLLLFLGITKDTFVDWNTEYALYDLIGGGVLLVIGIAVFIRNFAGAALSLENQQEDFLFKHCAPEEKRPYLAVGALYCLNSYRTVECLNKFYLQEAEDIENGRKNIDEDWGITDANTAIKQLDWLLQSGHRNDKKTDDKKEAIFAQINGQLELTDEVSELVIAIQKITYSNWQTKIDYIDPNEIYNCTSISGWDYIRGASVAKDCFNLNYLTEDEAWKYIVAFGKKVKEEFSSWEQLAVSFLIGRYIWSGDPFQEWCIDSFSELFSFYPEEEVNEFKSNIWKKYSISEL